MSVTVLAGILLLLAAPAYAEVRWSNKKPLGQDWEQQAYEAVHGGDGIEVPNWWTPHGTGTYWDWNAPTMSDAPNWLKRPQPKTRRHGHPGA